MSNQDVQKRIAALEEEIKASKQRLAELRRQKPPEEVKDYTLRNSFGQEVRLSSLFGAKSELILIHNMGPGCPYCTMWADGFNGVLKHLEDRVAFVLESTTDPAVQRQFAIDRGWAFQAVCSSGSSFRKDMGYADESGVAPGVSVFTKSADGKIHRVSDAGFGPGDNYCAVWDLFDLLPKGSEGVDVDYHYSKVR